MRSRSLFQLSQISLLLAGVALASGAGAFQASTDALVIYKGVDANGKTVFSNNPKEMRHPVKVHLSAPSIVGADPYKSYATAPKPAPSAPSAPALSSATPALALTPAEASANLEAARKAQADGVESLPGERQGTAGGGARLTPAYEARQRELAEKTIAAQQALDQSLIR